MRELLKRKFLPHILEILLNLAVLHSGVASLMYIHVHMWVHVHNVMAPAYYFSSTDQGSFCSSLVPHYLRFRSILILQSLRGFPLVLGLSASFTTPPVLFLTFWLPPCRKNSRRSYRHSGFHPWKLQTLSTRVAQKWLGFFEREIT